MVTVVLLALSTSTEDTCCSIERTCNTCFNFRENMTASSRAHSTGLRTRSEISGGLEALTLPCCVSSQKRLLLHCTLLGSFQPSNSSYTLVKRTLFDRAPIHHQPTPRRVAAGGTARTSPPSRSGKARCLGGSGWLSWLPEPARALALRKELVAFGLSVVNRTLRFGPLGENSDPRQVLL